MSQVKNPFLHTHDHDHDSGCCGGHDHEHGPLEPLDPAQQSLSDALRVSFFILKLVMIFMLVIYLLSGVFRVSEHERAVRLRFGAIVGEAGEQVYGPGWHFGWPYPIEQVIRVPVSTRSARINQAFWYELPANAAAQLPEEMANRGGPLNPERDGSLLTGDANIVHGRFSLSYVIDEDRVASYVENVGDLALAERIVTAAAEQGVVFAVAQAEVDEFIAGEAGVSLARRRAQAVLDEMNTGIRITGFSKTAEPPLAVSGAFKAVINAESARAQRIEAARREQARILGEAAGAAALPPAPGANGPLLELIREYEYAVQRGDAKEIASLNREIDQAFAELQVATETGPVAIGAQAAEIVNQATAYSTGIVEEVRAEARTLELLREAYRQNPRLLMSRLWQSAMEQMLTGDVETFYAMPGAPYIVTNSDPRVTQERQRQQYQQAQEAQKAQNAGRR